MYTSRVYANERDAEDEEEISLLAVETSLGLSTETVLPPTSPECLGKRQLSITEGEGEGRKKENYRS